MSNTNKQIIDDMLMTSEHSKRYSRVSNKKYELKQKGLRFLIFTHHNSKITWTVYWVWSKKQNLYESYKEFITRDWTRDYASWLKRLSELPQICFRVCSQQGYQSEGRWMWQQENWNPWGHAGTRGSLYN